jgi:hypothetical protein
MGCFCSSDRGSTKSVLVRSCSRTQECLKAEESVWGGGCCGLKNLLVCSEHVTWIGLAFVSAMLNLPSYFPSEHVVGCLPAMVMSLYLLRGAVSAQ